MKNCWFLNKLKTKFLQQLRVNAPQCPVCLSRYNIGQTNHPHAEAQSSSFSDLNIMDYFTSELFERQRIYVRKQEAAMNLCQPVTSCQSIIFSAFWSAGSGLWADYKHRITQALKHNQTL